MSPSAPHRIRSLYAATPRVHPLRLVYVAGLVLLGCEEEADSPYDDETVAACVADNHPEDGHDWYSDEQICPSGPPGSPPSECPPVTPQSVAEACEENGVTCDPDAFITRDAAICVARAEGLAEGVAAWDVHLVYHHHYQRPLWSVSNTTLDDPADCHQAGEQLSIDAETGEVLARLDWSSIC